VTLTNKEVSFIAHLLTNECDDWLAGYTPEDAQVMRNLNSAFNRMRDNDNRKDV
jgi:hypothetical protein